MKRLAILFVIIGVAIVVSFGQSNRTTRPRVVPKPTPKTPVIANEPNGLPAEKRPPVFSNEGRPSPASSPTSAPAVGDVNDEEIKIETNLVTMPVSVLDRDGRFISGLTKRDFQIFENGNPQKIEYFQSVEQPFTVVLLIDVSPSTQFRIEEIQDAAISFVNQLRPTDRVMVVAFDESIHVLTEPTSDRYKLRNAIRTAQFGDGTSLYEAVDDALNRRLKMIEGRKAIVLFTDGVDTTSRRANIPSTLEDAEETDALIYPIRFNTQRNGFGGNSGGGMNYPRRRSRSGGNLGSIIGIILGGQLPNVQVGGGAGNSNREYERGRQYLEELAEKSGGRKFEADTTRDLDLAFAGIAEELRRQYSIGYYPETVGQKGERRQIKVRVMRPDLVVRSKSSYVVGSSDNRFAGR